VRETESREAGEVKQEVNSRDKVMHIEKKKKHARKEKDGDRETDGHMCSDHWIASRLIGLARSLNSFPAARSIGTVRTGPITDVSESRPFPP